MLRFTWSVAFYLFVILLCKENVAFLQTGNGFSRFDTKNRRSVEVWRLRPIFAVKKDSSKVALPKRMSRNAELKQHTETETNQKGSITLNAAEPTKSRKSVKEALMQSTSTDYQQIFNHFRERHKKEVLNHSIKQPEEHQNYYQQLYSSQELDQFLKNSLPHRNHLKQGTVNASITSENFPAEKLEQLRTRSQINWNSVRNSGSQLYSLAQQLKLENAHSSSVESMPERIQHKSSPANPILSIAHSSISPSSSSSLGMTTELPYPEIFQKMTFKERMEFLQRERERELQLEKSQSSMSYSSMKSSSSSRPNPVPARSNTDTTPPPSAAKNSFLPKSSSFSSSSSSSPRNEVDAMKSDVSPVKLSPVSPVSSRSVTSRDDLPVLKKATEFSGGIETVEGETIPRPHHLARSLLSSRNSRASPFSASPGQEEEEEDNDQDETQDIKPIFLPSTIQEPEESNESSSNIGSLQELLGKAPQGKRKTRKTAVREGDQWVLRVVEEDDQQTAAE